MQDSTDRVGVRARVRFAQVPDWIITDPRISHGAMRLYALLARYANGDSEAWPKRKTLAAEIPGRSSGEHGVSLTSIDKWISELVQAGALTRDLRFRDNGMQTSTLYTVEMIPVPASPLSGEPGSPLSGEPGSPLSGEGKNESQMNESQMKETSPRAADADGTTQTLDLDDSPGCITCGQSRMDGHHHRQSPDITLDASTPARDRKPSRSKRDAWRIVAESRPDITDLLEYLADSVETCTGTRPKESKRAFDAMRLLVDHDKDTEKSKPGHTPAQVRGAIDWARASTFWSGVIMGAESLRKNYTKMQAQAVRDQRTPQQTATPPTSSPRVAQGLDLVRKYAAQEGYIPADSADQFNPLQITEGNRF